MRGITLRAHERDSVLPTSCYHTLQPVSKALRLRELRIAHPLTVVVFALLGARPELLPQKDVLDTRLAECRREPLPVELRVEATEGHGANICQRGDVMLAQQLDEAF